MYPLLSSCLCPLIFFCDAHHTSAFQLLLVYISLLPRLPRLPCMYSCYLLLLMHFRRRWCITPSSPHSLRLVHPP
ncbi:hypothetical protein C8Q77DRAFT_1127179 [Trametes polyzona]|nr:hypothetical protein C8Q77DRAFT_1127179 [Trametes polyzona]